MSEFGVEGEEFLGDTPLLLLCDLGERGERVVVEVDEFAEWLACEDSQLD